MVANSGFASYKIQTTAKSILSGAILIGNDVKLLYSTFIKQNMTLFWKNSYKRPLLMLILYTFWHAIPVLNEVYATEERLNRDKN